MTSDRGYFVHPSACVDEPATVGAGTKIWHFSHVMAGAIIGRDVVIGQNVYVAASVVIGDNVKIQNNVSLYDGVVLEDDVFCGPSCVFTNVKNPRAAIVRKGSYGRTVVQRGATIGANATIVCGVTIPAHAFLAAGAVLTSPAGSADGAFPPHALLVGVPARQVGWVSHHGHRLGPFDADGCAACPETGRRYRLVDGGDHASAGQTRLAAVE